MATPKASSNAVHVQPDKKLLGYVRLSYARREQDRGKVKRPEEQQTRKLQGLNLDEGEAPVDYESATRQEAAIRDYAATLGLEVEFYFELDGHRSGQSIINRPQWQKLMSRLSDGDVVGLIVYDLSRAHRKGWRVGQLIDDLRAQGKALYTAVPNARWDWTALDKQIMATIVAMLDEWYALEISTRQRNRAAFRRKLGITNGIAPFATTRDRDCRLKLSQRGAWRLPTSDFVAGDYEKPVDSNAEWLCYADTARRILTLYANEELSCKQVALQCNAEGLPFQSRTGRPREVTLDDVRRVVNNWPEYAGLLGGGRAKDRTPEMLEAIREVAINPERAVFPVELLRAVAIRRHAQATTYAKPKQGNVTLDNGVNVDTSVYPLRGVLHCASCTRKMRQDPAHELRGWLGGMEQRGIRHYRHKPADRCSCTHKSVRAEHVEQQVSHVLRDIRSRAGVMSLLHSIAVGFKSSFSSAAQNDNAIRETREVTRSITNLNDLFKRNHITQQEHEKLVSSLHSQLTMLRQAQEGKTHTRVSWVNVFAQLDHLDVLWSRLVPQQRSVLIRLLFESITYDLDRQLIVSVKLKSWAEPLLTLPLM